MLAIRLQRVGKAKKPTYRLIVSEKGRDTQDHYLELLGTYNPHDKEKGIVFQADRIKYWLEKGAVASNTVHNLLLKQGLVQGEKRKSVFLSERRKKKLAEKKAASAPKETPAAPVAPAETPAA